MSGIIKKLVQRRVRNKKDFFLNSAFFEELSRFKVLCKNRIFDIFSLTFGLNFCSY